MKNTVLIRGCMPGFGLYIYILYVIILFLLFPHFTVGPGTQFIGGHGSMSGGSHGSGQMTGQGPPSSNAMMTSSGGPVSSGGGGGGMSSGGGSGGSGSATAAFATYRQVVMVSKGPAPTQSQTAATCKNCGIRSANTGHSWCQICYQQKS